MPPTHVSGVSRVTILEFPVDVITVHDRGRIAVAPPKRSDIFGGHTRDGVTAWHFPDAMSAHFTEIPLRITHISALDDCHS